MVVIQEKLVNTTIGALLVMQLATVTIARDEENEKRDCGGVVNCETCSQKCNSCNPECTSCVAGFYGRDCSLTCPSNCQKNLCFMKSGQCRGCKDGFYITDNKTCIPCPIHCKTCNFDNNCLECETGYSDRTCSKRCTNCKEGTPCKINSGYCEYGCKKGLSGNFCNISCSIRCYSCERLNENICVECEHNTYGPDCSENCSFTCFNESCDSKHGTCTHGCKHGSWGDKCQNKCSADCEKICERSNGSCTVGNNVPAKDGDGDGHTEVVVVILCVCGVGVLVALVIGIIFYRKRNRLCFSPGRESPKQSEEEEFGSENREDKPNENTSLLKTEASDNLEADTTESEVCAIDKNLDVTPDNRRNDYREQQRMAQMPLPLGPVSQEDVSTQDSVTVQDSLKVAAPRLIRIKRASIIEDLIREFMVEFVGKVKVEFEGEQAVDENAVFRDCLSIFWARLIETFFEGEEQAAPVFIPALRSGEWAAIGRIFIQGFRQVGYVPPRFSTASIIYAVLKKTPSANILRSSWIASLGGYYRRLMQEIQDGGMTSHEVDVIAEVFERYEIDEMPSSQNIQRITLRCAEIAMIEKAAFPLNEMRLTKLREEEAFQSPEAIQQLLDRLRPDGQKVADLLTADPKNQAQQTALSFLRQAIRTFDDNLLSRFLRFVSGSNVCNIQRINVQFVPYDLKSHTCSCTIDLPVTYKSFKEFFRELKKRLPSDI